MGLLDILYDIAIVEGFVNLFTKKKDNDDDDNNTSGNYDD